MRWSANVGEDTLLVVELMRFGHRSFWNYTVASPTGVHDKRSSYDFKTPDEAQEAALAHAVKAGLV